MPTQSNAGTVPSLEDVLVDFVLVRGPASLDRRLPVRLTGNGVPVTVGRATHCTVLLDPSLLFSSQVQCSLFALRAKPSASPAPPADGSSPATSRLTDSTQLADTPDAAARGQDVTPRQTFHTPRAAPSTAVKVYITDMCSSNGTFVNGVRISGTDPTELKQGDVCIFGGMRDVEVGEALPADAYNGPELVQWGVDLRGALCEAEHDFDFTATPLVLPAKDVLAAEVRALMKTVQRSLPVPRPSHPSQALEGSDPLLFSTPAAAAQRPPSGDSTSITNGAAGRLADDGDDAIREDYSPRGVPQQLFTSPVADNYTAATSTDVREGKELAAIGETLLFGGDDGDRQRSVSLVATPSVPEMAEAEVAVPADPPYAVHYTAVRVGNVACSPTTTAVLQRACCEEQHVGEERGERAASPADAGEGTPADGKRPRETSASRPVTPSAANKRARVEGEAAVLPLVLTCTATHLKWSMANPNDLLEAQLATEKHADAGVAHAMLRKPFFGMLPVTSLATVLVCPTRRGLAVELKEGCQLPLVQPAVMSGPAESRWVVWTLAEDMAAEVAAPPLLPSTVTSSSSGGSRKAKKPTGKRQKGRVNAVNESTAEAQGCSTTTEEARAEQQTPVERFQAWVAHLELFYRRQGVPTPHEVDAATFDLILAPPPSSPTE